MISTLEKYLNSSIKYNFESGPKEVRSFDEAREQGINCIALAHIASRELFNASLPKDAHCYELFSDHKNFVTVTAPKPGDLIWFGRQKLIIPVDKFVPEYDDYGYLLNHEISPVNHGGLIIDIDDRGEPQILHASHTAGGISLTSLSEFQAGAYPRHNQVLRISRLIVPGEIQLPEPSFQQVS